MSSRLMPPKVGAIISTALTMSSSSCPESTMGTESMPANSRNRMAFPSMTGRPAKPPMLPSPSTALPSETTATVFHFLVYVYAAKLCVQFERFFVNVHIVYSCPHMRAN